MRGAARCGAPGYLKEPRAPKTASGMSVLLSHGL